MLEEACAPRRCSRNGFSLCEVMVASAVLAVSLLGLAQLLGLAFMQDQMSRYNGMAVELGRGKVEQLRQLYIEQLTTGTTQYDLSEGEHGPETVILTNGVVGYENQSLNVSWTVASAGPVRKNLQVSVVPTGMATPEEVMPLLAKTVKLETVLLP